MTPFNSIGCIALGISALCAVAAFARGEWDIKRRNDALNQSSDLVEENNHYGEYR